MKTQLQKLEYHVVNACNRSCEFCCHYSNFVQPAKLRSVEQAREEWTPWAERVQPAWFILLGGEPTLNKELEGLAELAREIWTGAKIGLFTNGHRLEKFPRLPSLLDTLDFSLYDAKERAEMQAKVQPFRDAGVKVTFADFTRANWLEFYNLVDGKPQPWQDNRPAEAWANCSARYCHVLYENKLWKCPQVAFHKTVDIDWEHFVGYKPCTLEDDPKEWAERTYEDCCRHCPSDKIVHLG